MLRNSNFKHGVCGRHRIKGAKLPTRPVCMPQLTGGVVVNRGWNIFISLCHPSHTQGAPLLNFDTLLRQNWTED